MKIISLLSKISFILGCALLILFYAAPDTYEKHLGLFQWYVLLMLPSAIEQAIVLFGRSIKPPPYNQTFKPGNELLGPFLCRPTKTSMGFWMSTWNDVSNLEIEIFDSISKVSAIKLTQINKRFNTFLGEVEGLKANTEYTYSVKVDGKTYTPEWSQNFKFTTLPDSTTPEISFFSMSCHGKREWEKSENPAALWSMWTQLHKSLSDKTLHFGVLGGDQVYMDSQFEPLMNQYASLDESERVYRIKEIYFDYWCSKEYQQVLCQIPTVLMWDDHDLNDGFGSRADSFDGNELDNNWKEYKKDLSEAFFAFQANRNLGTDQESSNYSFHFGIDQLSLVGLDLRSERNVKKELMLSQQSKEKIESSLADDSKPLFILSPVTVTRISGGIEDLLGQVSNTLWRYTRFLGHGAAYKKVLIWNILFLTSFVCLQIPEERTSIVLSSILLLGTSMYMFLASLLRKITNQRSEIEGVSLVVIKSMFGYFALAGAVGIIWETVCQSFEWEQVSNHISSFVVTEAHNLLITMLPLSLGTALCFDSKRFKKSGAVINKIGLIFIAFFAICLTWHGLPDEYIRLNFLIKAPAALISFFFLITTILESLHAVDEIAGLDDDIKDSWSSQANTGEIKWLFELIKKQERPVYLLCGDIHTGGLSEIKIGSKLIPQITTSPITYPPMPPLVEKFTSGLKKMPLPKKDPQAMAENYFFISKRNYALITSNINGTAKAEFVFEGYEKSLVVEVK